MTKGEAKEFLSRAFYIRREEKRLEMKISELRSLRERVTPSYSMAAGGGPRDNLTDLTAKITEFEQEQRDKIVSYLEAYREAEKAIMFVESVDIRLAEVLRLRYLESERWEQIACDLHYSWRQVFNLHNKALKVLCREKILDDKEKSIYENQYKYYNKSIGGE